MKNRIDKMTAKPTDIYAFIAEYTGGIDVISEQFQSSWKGRIDPEWYRKTAPASEEEIATLKRVSGFEARGYDIPKQYLAFLRRMGQNDGGLLSNYFDCCSDIRHLIEYYEEKQEEYFDDEPNLQDNQLLISIGAMTNEPDFYLTVKEDGSHEVSGRHYTWAHKKPTDYYAETFDQFLMQIVFHLYEQAKYKNTVFLTSCYNDNKDNVQQYGDETLMQMLREWAERHGFQKSWCSDKWHYYGFKEKSCLIVHRGFAYSGLIRTDDWEELKNWEEEINSLLNTHTEE